MSENLCWCPVYNNLWDNNFKDHSIAISSWTSSQDKVNCVFLLMNILNLTNSKKKKNQFIIRGVLIHIMKYLCFLEVVQVLTIVQETKTLMLIYLIFTKDLPFQNSIYFRFFNVKSESKTKCQIVFSFNMYVLKIFHKFSFNFS